MLQPNFAVYLGKEKAGGFFGVVAQDNLFLIIEVEDGMDAEVGREIIQKIKDFYLKTQLLFLMKN